jgi:hypothetical protein
MYGIDVLSEDALNQRQIIKDFGIDATQILLDAAWVFYEDSWHEFLRYPERLVDSTHGTITSPGHCCNSLEETVMERVLLFV